MTYSIKKASCSDYSINKGTQTLFQLSYPSIWSSEAFGVTKDGRYFIEKENIWGSRFRITKNGKRIGNFHCNWLGRVNIDLIDNDGKLFQLNMRHIGLFKTRFAVYLENNIHLFTMHGRYDNFRLGYDVETHQRAGVNFPLDDLIGLLTYGAGFYLRASGMN